MTMERNSRGSDAGRAGDVHPPEFSHKSGSWKERLSDRPAALLTTGRGEGVRHFRYQNQDSPRQTGTSQLPAGRTQGETGSQRNPVPVRQTPGAGLSPSHSLGQGKAR